MSELDCQVAREVMGWTFNRYKGEAWWYCLRNGPYSQDLWRPTERIEKAWKVVERMREQGWLSSHRDVDGRYLWNFRRCDSITGSGRTANTAPEAICRAALAAVRLEDAK